MTDLLPCPFCGGEADIVDQDCYRCAVLCTGCRAQMGYHTDGDGTPSHEFDTPADAIAAWNRRADLPPKVKPLVWEQRGRSCRAAAPLFGSIRVEDYASGKWIILWSAPGICDTFTPGAYDTQESAQTAAQADYTARILAAIEVPS